MNPINPLYVVSHKRADSRITMRALTKMGVPYKVVIEPSQYDDYAKVFPKEQLLVVPDKYHDEYDTCDHLGMTKSQGPGPARNYAWDHSIAQGFKWHWVMDDNINEFYYLNRNNIYIAKDGTLFRLMEDFCDRYENVTMAGPQYKMFVPRKSKHPPFTVNTRIYSCNLIRNDAPFRWRGRYNEDTDLSLRMLKAGYCTIVFYAYLQNKLTTQSIVGGNTDEFYAVEGTFNKSKMQVDLHPDVSRMVWKYNRWHHYVDYKRFKANKLKLRDDVIIPKKTPYKIVAEKAGTR